MRHLFKAMLGSAALVCTLIAQAQVPADAPAGTTVQCKDGSYASPDTRSGACRGHKGIKTWFGKTATSTGAAAPATAAVQTQSAAVSATQAAPTTGIPSKTPAVKDAATNTAAAAAGGGAGKVWVNDETKVYHCMGDRYYGKTKKGEYLSEADAKSKGMHAAHAKACTT